MIITEDKELAQFSLTEGCIAVPMEVYQPIDGEMRVTVYPGLEGMAQEFVRLFSRDPFSPDAIHWLKDRLTPYVGEYGMAPSRDVDVHFLDYRIYDRDALPMRNVLPDTELAGGHTDMSEWINATTHALEMDPDDPDDACAIHRVGSTIAAYAALNDFPEEEDVLEIHVECAPAYRKKGICHLLHSPPGGFFAGSGIQRAIRLPPYQSCLLPCGREGGIYPGRPEIQFCLLSKRGMIHTLGKDESLWHLMPVCSAVSSARWRRS